jgi:hypothetical protein
MIFFRDAGVLATGLNYQADGWPNPDILFSTPSLQAFQSDV